MYVNNLKHQGKSEKYKYVYKYIDHGLENHQIEVLMPSYLKLIIGGFDAEIIFSLKTNNHYVNNEVVVYSNKIGITIPAKILKF